MQADKQLMSRIHCHTPHVPPAPRFEAGLAVPTGWVLNAPTWKPPHVLPHIAPLTFLGWWQAPRGLQ